MSLRSLVAIVGTVAACGTSSGERSEGGSEERGSLAEATDEGRALVAAVLGGEAGEPGAGFRAEAGGWRAKRGRGAVEVTVPGREDGAVRVWAGGVSVGVRRLGSEATAARAMGDVAVYAHGDGEGTVVRVLDDGVEDHVRREAARGRAEAIEYAIELGEGALGLRQIGARLEVLGAGGVPRLRMDVPYVKDAAGRSLEATVAVSGCAVDRDPASPVGRVKVRGEGECRLRVSWSGARYPVVVDPAWRSTGTMAVARRRHGATLLGNGQVLIAGGTASTTTELYVPAAGSADEPGAFVLTGPLPEGDIDRAAMATVGPSKALPKGGAIYHGGTRTDGDLEARSWLYDQGSGTWRAGPNFAPALSWHQLVTLADGRLLVAGGEGPDGAESVTAIYDPAVAPDGVWQLRKPMLTERRRHATAVTGSAGHERVLVAGGKKDGLVVSTAIYDVAKDEWAPGPDLGEARSDLTGTTLLDGRVMVAGGALDNALYSKTVDLIDVLADKPAVTTLAPLGASRGRHGAARLGDGRVLLTGGSGTIQVVPSGELYDPVAQGSRQTMMSPRYAHTTTWLGGTRVLMAGGEDSLQTFASAQLFRLLGQGKACVDDEECSSGFCTDGVCCEEACQGECEACAAAVRQTSGADGVCEARGSKVPRRQVAGGACEDQSGEPCGHDGLCNGAARTGPAACHLPASETLCGEKGCSGPDYAFSVCNGQGACELRTCSPYRGCASATECTSTCVPGEPGQCVDQHACKGGQCVPLQKQGVDCDADEQCQSGFCVDGVCCDTACDSRCQACSAKAKGQGQDGTCGPVADGVPSPSECVPEEPVTCGRTGACNGKGDCALHGPTAVCGDDTCNARPDAPSAVYSYRCQGGKCEPGVKQECSFYACSAQGGSCATACVDSSGCTGGALCVSGTCQAPRANGEPCEQDNECQSHVCADGVCCNRACAGRCEACDGGTCQVVTGQARHGACEAPAQVDDPCAVRACDGTAPDECVGFVGAATACGQARCKGDDASVLLEVPVCGGGTCQPPTERSCAPYLCASGACLEACGSDSDCAGRARCTGQTCVLEAGCDSDTVLAEADGTTRSCAPFRCDAASRACFGRCASSADCALGSVCDSDGRCSSPRSPDAGSSGGCAVTRRGASGQGAASLLAGLMLGALAWRRRARAVGRAVGAAAVITLGGCADRGPGAEGAIDLSGGSGHGGATGLIASASPGSLVRAGALLRAAGDGGLEASEVTGYRATGAGWRPVLRGRERVTVELPVQADGATEVRAVGSDVSVRVRLAGATGARGVQARGGTVVYDGALGPGTALIHRPSTGGTEDYLMVDEATGRGEMRYEVELGDQVAGVRHVSTAVEFLDAEGTPRLRMASPGAWRAHGERVAVRAEVLGCEVDRDPRAPWGRPVRRPGASRCEVRLTWAPGAGALLVDPAWQSTGDLNEGRFLHTATLLPSGLVLVAGGGQKYTGGSISGERSTAELYNQAKNSWATTGDLHHKRAWHGAWLLASGRVLVAAGSGTSDSQDSSEVYDPATGKWTLTGDLEGGRYTQASGTLSNGTPFVCAGYASSPDTYYLDAQTYDEAAGAWKKLPGTMDQPYRYASAFAIPGNRMLVAGGVTYTNGKDTRTDATDIYDVEKGTWTPGPKLTKGRVFPGTAATPAGIVYAGGIDAFGDGASYQTLGSVDLFRFSDDKVVSLATMKKARVEPTVTWLEQLGRVMVAGGADALAGALGSAELVSTDTALATTTDAGTMKAARAFASSTLLPSGALLVAGGGTGSPVVAITASTASELFATAGLGEPCTQDGECPRTDPTDPTSQHCVDGVCCNTACTGTCMACSAVAKGQGASGFCGNVVAGPRPADCPTSTTNCGLTGACDGQGACVRIADGTECSRSCAGDAVVVGHCQQTGGADSCQLTTTSCGLGLCDVSTSTCRTACTTTADCTSDAYCEPATKVCTGRLPLGSACPGNDACASGFCTDGVCCAESCTDKPCHACSAAMQDPSASPASGQCKPASGGSNPRGLCSGLPCDHHPTCGSDGECRPYEAGETCANTLCVGTPVIGFGLTQFVCKPDEAQAGKLRCEPSTATPAPCDSRYGCRDGACLTGCQEDSDCTDSAHCKGGQCTPRIASGEACTVDAECRSGFCTDGVCCKTACKDPCGRCDSPGQKGQCVPTTEPPAQQGRSTCEKTTGGDPCSERQCDGVHREACLGFVGGKVPCREASCQDGVARQQAFCDGHGACDTRSPKECFPYRCGPDDACLEACTDSADCAGTNRCQGGVCVGQLVCDRASGTLRDASGRIAKSCGVYRCDEEIGTCLARCASSADCAQSAVCSSQGACEALPLPSDPSDDGCGCRLPAGPTSPAAAPLALLALAALAHRRRSPAPRRARPGGCR